jgi:hypothetical protein
MTCVDVAAVLSEEELRRIARALERRFVRASYAALGSWLFRRAVHAYRATARGRLRAEVTRAAVRDFVEHADAAGMPLPVARRRRRSYEGASAAGRLRRRQGRRR